MKLSTFFKLLLSAPHGAVPVCGKRINRAKARKKPDRRSYRGQ
jgi:hypothetical protein